jgi:hypothetical protein
MLTFVHRPFKLRRTSLSTLTSGLCRVVRYSLAGEGDGCVDLKAQLSELLLRVPLPILQRHPRPPRVWSRRRWAGTPECSFNLVLNRTIFLASPPHVHSFIIMYLPSSVFYHHVVLCL